ncbi:MAG TPA: M15 family metallopeptidase [Candidatus Kapabacteria bacterium]|nr:M15 family metallopeptidase [Candidatus Kapabacteria bacterium]
MKNVCIFLILFVATFNLSCNDNISDYKDLKGIDKNKYGLEVITKIEQYQQLIKIDSNNRLVDLGKFIPNIALDIRYATKNNFTGQQVYDSAFAFARLPVAIKLKAAQEELSSKGLGFKIFDSYRPYSITLKFWDIIGDSNYVATPWGGSRHNRGCAIDLTLIDLQTGEELAMPSKFDEFNETAHPDNNNFPIEILNNRKILIDIMAKYGFRVYPTEWWHFDFVGYEKYPITDIKFESLDSLK